MAFPPPPQQQNPEVSYTTVVDLTAATPGTRRLQGSGNVASWFASFDTGNGPTGSFAADALIGGSVVGSIVVPMGNDEAAGDIVPVAPWVDGDGLTFAITDDGGATGPVVLGIRGAV